MGSRSQPPRPAQAQSEEPAGLRSSAAQSCAEHQSCASVWGLQGGVRAAVWGRFPLGAAWAVLLELIPSKPEPEAGMELQGKAALQQSCQSLHPGGISEASASGWSSLTAPQSVYIHALQRDLRGGNKFSSAQITKLELSSSWGWCCSCCLCPLLWVPCARATL